MSRIFLPLLCLVTTLPVAAEMYKWVDETGQIHYSEKRPAGSEYEEVKAPPASSSGVSMGTEAPAETEVVPDDWATKELEQRERASADKATRDARCAQAQAHLAGLKQVGRIFTTDEAGNRRYYTEEERAAQLGTAQEIVDRECG